MNTTLSGSCTDNAGKVAPASVPIHYDATPPTMNPATPSRPPDANGWYNHPVTFTFTGADAVSGISNCTSETYSGPASAFASVTGSCTDLAGNVATLSVPLHYDATPPSLSVAASAGDGSVNLTWQASAPVAPITALRIERTPGFHGAQTSVLQRGKAGSFLDSSVRNGVAYRYTITAQDDAGNATVRAITVTPGRRLLSPANGAKVTKPPQLSWTTVPGATYYNVQVYRDNHKVLSIWPGHAKLQLKQSWHFGGHVRRLKPATYRWYVWPGYGQRSAARYGSMVGKGTFVMKAAKAAVAAYTAYPDLRTLAPDANR